MALPKPAKKPQWATGAADIVEPGDAKKAIGWLVEKPPHQFWNWFWNLCYQWIAYFESKTDELNDNLAAEIGARDAAVLAEQNSRTTADTLLTNKVTRVFDYIVGSAAGCTHAKLQDALTIAPAGSRILVTASEAIDANNIFFNNTEVVLKPDVVLTPSGTPLFGIEINGTGCRISGGKISGFTNKAILVRPAAVNTLISDIILTGNTVDIDDASDNATTYGIMNG